ncbi:cupredoxin domain-containing protein [Halobacterium litoreum]|uniref:Cupredoxin domain-containing protein n=1 Tax=Halobacterium litoreum TaxID=2039234 RepID=A0ABD5NHY9_9EURY|nr:cupredoxin domain-containing protein [Halobacterium litoreum]UHH12427.1 cupredoxin domain-containing protein [Halobacterium litoreum]
MTLRHAGAAVAVLVLALASVVGATALTDASVASGDSSGFAHPTPDGDATPETTLVENGSVVNANTDTAPGGCAEIRGERHVTIHAGSEYADPGEAFGYDVDTLTASPCTRLVVTLVNHDDVRHQWMAHGLPSDTYPMGMFTIEVADRGRVTGTFVTPAQSGEYQGHCSLPQHEQKGMRLPLVITDGPGDATTQSTTTESGGTSLPVPGFGALAALAALAAAALLAVRD